MASYGRHGHDGSRRHALHPGPFEDDDPFRQRTEHLPGGDRGQAQQHVSRAGVAHTGNRKRKAQGAGRPRLRTGRAGRRGQERPAADHAEQPRGAELAAGGVRTRLGAGDLSDRVRKNTKTQYQTLSIQSVAIDQIKQVSAGNRILWILYPKFFIVTESNSNNEASLIVRLPAF